MSMSNRKEEEGRGGRRCERVALFLETKEGKKKKKKKKKEKRPRPDVESIGTFVECPGGKKKEKREKREKGERADVFPALEAQAEKKGEEKKGERGEKGLQPGDLMAALLLSPYSFLLLKGKGEEK